ncbi:MAG: ATP-binding protein, partial [Desulfobacterales bacterium]|nr:ATP-binding protein [Desulfobacterales bacterium]
MDIGTTRVVPRLLDLSNNQAPGDRHWLIGRAGAAGSALEGGVTRMKMTAGP